MKFILTEQDVRAIVENIVGSTLRLPEAVVADEGGRVRIDDKAGFGADSLEMMEIATHVSRFFRLHATGLEDELLRWRTIEDWTATILRSWEHSDEKSLTFLTSGTTDRPKGCTHEWRLLVQEIRTLADLFTDRKRVVGTVPHHHIYGFLWTVLLPRYLGVPFFEARDMLPGGLIKSLQQGDLLVSFPLLWDHLAKAGVAFPPGVEGVTSTSPCPPELIYSLKALSLERMVEMYGSSETGGIGWRDDPKDPYRLLPYWSLTDEGDSLVREGLNGDEVQPVAAPDRLVVGERGGFVVAGHRDHTVQVGGVNVFPSKIARTISSHPDVFDCEVRLMRPDEGQRLKAFVVLDENVRDTDDVRRKLDRWVRKSFSAPERPSSLTFGTTVPRDALGKVADWYS